jgi:hypothetical protein
MGEDEGGGVPSRQRLCRNVILRRKPKHVLSKAKELMRSFTEFTLSQKGRPFVSLRVTDGEGFRMTLRVRFFAEFTLSQKARPFASLRVAHGEGFRMTNKAIQGIVTQFPGEG